MVGNRCRAHRRNCYDHIHTNASPDQPSGTKRRRLAASRPGVGDTTGPEDETLDAIKHHNEIRDAVAHVAKYQAGSDPWYQAVADVNEVNSEHLAVEEREGMTDFRQQTDLQSQHDLAIQFAYFEAAHVAEVRAANEDPEGYVNETLERQL